MARSADPLSYATVVAYVYFPGIPFGVLAGPMIGRCARSRMRYGLPNDPVTIWRWSSPGRCWALRWCTATRMRSVTADRSCWRRSSDVILRRGHSLSELRLINVYLARERARRGDRDEAIPLMFAAVDQLVREGQLLSWGIPATGVLVETLLDRGAEGDVAEAEAAIERLAAAPADDGLVIRDIWLLRLRALLARAHGDDAAYRDFRDRYRDDGGIAWLRRTHRDGEIHDRMKMRASRRIQLFRRAFTLVSANYSVAADRRHPPGSRLTHSKSALRPTRGQ